MRTNGHHRPASAPIAECHREFGRLRDHDELSGEVKNAISRLETNIRTRVLF